MLDPGAEYFCGEAVVRRPMPLEQPSCRRMVVFLTFCGVVGMMLALTWYKAFPR